MLLHSDAVDATWPAPRRETINHGGDAIDRALRLGALAVGCPLVFTEAGSEAETGGERFPTFAAGPFQETLLVERDEAVFGALRAVNLASRPLLDEAQRSALADVANLIATTLVTRRRLGQTDMVTGLPNRHDFELAFGAALAQAGREPVLAIVTLTDAGRYAEIVRALGLANAELFVRAGAGALVAALGGDAAVWHVGPLNFAFLTDGDRAEALAQEIVRALSGPILCGTLPILAEIGVGLAPLLARARAAESLRAALAAAQDSFSLERGYAFYDLASDRAHQRAFHLLTDLDEALHDYGQLSLVYQPRIELWTRRIVGAEALVRWNHPTLGAIPPAEFIALSETTALIGPLTDFVMTQACRQAAAWRHDGLMLRTSINVSPRSLRDAGFLDRFDRIAADAGIAPEAMEFEFTEGVLTSHEASVRARIDSVRARGIKIAIDDFGIGYSNIEALTRLPADVLKIDKSLVQQVDVDHRRSLLCRTVVELAQNIGFHLVAEGIETRAVFDMLRAWRCHEGQGYFMSPPLTASDFAEFAAAQKD